MPKKPPKSVISQKRVLDAAARIFREQGYSGTTMRAIGDAADLKAGSIYYHFPSKDDLITAVLDLGMTAVSDRVVAAVEAVPPGGSVRRKMEAAIRAHMSAIIEFGDYTLASRRVFGQVPEAVRSKHMRLRDTYGSFWQDMLTQARDGGEMRADVDVRLVRLFILGALNWTVEWFKPGVRSIDAVAHEFATMVLDGLMVHDGMALSPALGPVEPAPPRRRRAVAETIATDAPARKARSKKAPA